MTSLDKSKQIPSQPIILPSVVSVFLFRPIKTRISYTIEKHSQLVACES